MKLLAVLSVLAGSAVAFTTLGVSPRAAATRMYDGKADLEAIAEKSNPLLKVRRSWQNAGSMKRSENTKTTFTHHFIITL